MTGGERVWRPALPARTYEWAVIPEDVTDGWKFEQAVRELPIRGDSWSPVPVELVSPLDGEVARRAAIPWWSSSKNVLVLRDEAIKSVGAVLAEHGELLSLEGRNAQMVMFSAPLVVDALIEQESDLRKSPGSFVVRLDRGTFDGEAVRGLQAFVAPVGRGHDLFLRDELVGRLAATGDTSGVKFEEVGAIR